MVYNKLIKGLMGACALSALSVSSAYAAGITAGTTVSNEFTLTYTIGTEVQPSITNSDSPAEFVVDRRIDLATASLAGGDSATPGQDDYTFEFTFVNESNDAANFVFTAADNGGAVTLENPRIVSYWIDADGNGTQGAGETTVPYTAGAAPEFNPDVTIYVTADADIPEGAANSAVGTLLFTATATNSGGTVLSTSASNTIDGEETVLDDGSGATDSDDDATHTATANVSIGGADISGTKFVAIVSTDGSGCNAFTVPANTSTAFAIPGACVEYTIFIANASGGEDAVNIGVEDILAQELILMAVNDDGLGGSFSSPASIPAAGIPCDGTNATCNVVYGGGTLSGGSTGTVVIRALIKSE